MDEKKKTEANDWFSTLLKVISYFLIVITFPYEIFSIKFLIKKNSIFIHIEITDKKIIDSSNIIYNRVIECLNLIDEYKGLDLKISYSIVDSGEENIDIGPKFIFAYLI